MSKEKIYKVIQHRGQMMHMNKEIKEHIMETYPEIKETDMVEILEHRSYQLNNTWETESISKEFIDVEIHGYEAKYVYGIDTASGPSISVDSSDYEEKINRINHISHFGISKLPPINPIPDISGMYPEMMKTGFEQTIENGAFVHNETLKSIRKSNKRHIKESRRENRGKNKNE